ncbi:MAG: TetR/AcrR family transcriptional regulator [Laribacter sp.]|nr:TetR/AcrR family transcriptional regulator [Laribacter sp.]MBP9526758.1 TetR/AcrR family transcriptional regulator [Laribacter sp.]MBP9607769.1 TetR/AcrR family transcriptional regulator [Laribacter sp.]
MEHDTAPRWERRKASRPDEILDAALPLFVERGYAATKIEHIAQAAGVTKGTPYLYFENKAEIFKSVVRRGLVPLTHSCEALALDRSQPARERLFGAVRLWVEAVDSAGGGGLVRLMLAEAGNFPELSRFYFDEVVMPTRQLVRQVLAEGVASGEFRACLSLDHATEILMAPVMMALLWRHSFPQFESSRHDLGAHLQQFDDLLALGLLARAPSA